LPLFANFIYFLVSFDVALVVKGRERERGSDGEREKNGIPPRESERERPPSSRERVERERERVESKNNLLFFVCSSPFTFGPFFLDFVEGETVRDGR
jgi:hypothetical protein